MSGEYINAKSIEDYWKQLKTIYQSRSTDWKDLTKAEYDVMERSERSDSDNHLNEERLGKDTQVIDICHYKYLPDRVVAYKIEMKDINGNKQEAYFQIKLSQE